MVRCKWVGVAGAVMVLAVAAASCGPAETAGPALSAADRAMVEKAKASGSWDGKPMPGLTLARTERQVVYEGKISAVIQKLMSNPANLSRNDFGSPVINTEGAADLPTILGEAGFKDYMANVRDINFARAAMAERSNRR